MKPLEERLRSALDARAQTFETSPQAWLDTQRRTRPPRRRGRWLLAVVPVIAIALIIPVLLNGGLGRKTARDPDELYRKLMEGMTPAGQQVLIDNPSEGKPLRLWQARGKLGNPVLCVMVEQAKGEPYGTCGTPMRAFGDRSGWYEGTTRTDTAERYVDYGAASDDVATVTAVTEDGRRIAGTVHRSQGAPWIVWSIALTNHDQVKTVEFADSKGRKGLDESPAAMRHESRGGKPIGMPLYLDDGLILQPYDFDILGERLFLFRQGKELSFRGLSERQRFNDPLGKGTSPIDLSIEENVAWGVAKQGTATIEVTIGTGEPLTLQARPDPWNLGLAIFAAPAFVTLDFGAGLKEVGYDTGGKQIWRKDIPARQVEPRHTLGDDPIGEIMTIPGTEDFTKGPAKVWFARLSLQGSKDLMLCSSGGTAPNGGDMGGCGNAGLDRGGYGGGGRLDSYLPEPGSTLSFGTAADDVESMDAVTADGRRLPGTIVRGKGTPTPIWYVRHPMTEKIADFVFKARGKQLEVVRHNGMEWCWEERKPAGDGQPLLDGMTANLHDGSCLKFWRNGKDQPGSFQPAAGAKLSSMIAAQERPLQWSQGSTSWYGFTLPGTARVEVTLKGGGKASADTVPDPWGQGVRLFSGELPAAAAKEGLFWVGMEFTGYDSDGSALWTYRPKEPG